MQKAALRFHSAGSSYVARRLVADEGASLSAGLGSRSVVASYELCDFRQVALPLWMVRPNPSCHPVPCQLLCPLPSHLLCISHADLSFLSTSRPLSLLFPLLGIPFLAGPTLSGQCSPVVFFIGLAKKGSFRFFCNTLWKKPEQTFWSIFHFLSCCFTARLTPFSGWELHQAASPKTILQDS